MARRALGRKWGRFGRPFVPPANILEPPSIDAMRDRADAPAGLGQELAPGHRQIVAAGAARGTRLRAHLLSASSRLKNRLATMVHAASSGAGIDAFGAESPTATSAFEALPSAA